MPMPSSGSSTTLSEMQSVFARALLDCEVQAPSMFAAKNGSRAARGFNVYRNNVYASLVASVLAKFPAFQTLVGSDFAQAAARIFVESQPPVSPILLLYGSQFPDFLAAFEPAQTVPYLADVARLEWAIAEAYSAADAPVATPDAFAALPIEEAGHATITLHPAVRIVSSIFPIYAIWSANTSGQEPAGRCVAAGSESALVVRPAENVKVLPLTPGAEAFVTACRDGATADAATTAARAAADDFDLSKTLVALVSSGAITSVTLTSHKMEARDAYNN